MQAKEHLYESLREGERWWTLKTACDLWAAAFFTPLQPADGTGDLVPTTRTVRRALEQPKALDGRMVGEAQDLAQRLRFFHWPLEFPDVFARGGFDVVVGNPPYVASATMKREDPRLRRYATVVYRSARGNWDAYVVFVERAYDLTRPSGRHGMVTPTRMLASDYCADLQDLLLQRRLISCADFSALKLFGDAAVSVAVVVAENGHTSPDWTVRFVRYGEDFEPTLERTATVKQLRSLPPGYICFPLTARDMDLFEFTQTGSTLGDMVDASDGSTTAEAYEIRNLVFDGSQDSAKAVDCVRLVNTGTIDPFRILWGVTQITFLGFRGRWPVLRRSDLERVAPRRMGQADAHTVVVAGMGRRIEAAVAPDGFLCGKSAVVLLPEDGICPYALAAVLNSQTANAVYRGLFGLRGVREDWMSIGPKQLTRLPMPDGKFLRPNADFAGSDTIESLTGSSINVADVLEDANVLSQIGQALSAVDWGDEGSQETELQRSLVGLADSCAKTAYRMSHREE